MSSALYRKYRPQTFSQMIGQSHIKITLQHELERGEIGHAYLFCGPRGLGKTTSARLFAKAVNCEKRQAGESEPCNECQSCLDIIAGKAVDIIEIDAASNTGVDNVRENIIENSRFNPIRSKFKVFIIDEVHMLSTSAFNALLKILEEPPSHVIFILCTTEIHKLPVTIISRCQRFDFKKVTGEQLLKRLQLVVEGENKKVAEEALKRIVMASEGCVRDAESLLSKILSLGDDIDMAQAEIVLPKTNFEVIANFFSYLSEKNSSAAIELINRLVEEGFDLMIFSENVLEFARQMMLIKTSGGLEIYGVELSDNLNTLVSDLSKKFNWAELLDMIELFSDKVKEIRSATISQLPLEVAVVRLVNNINCSKPDQLVFASSATKVTLASQPAIKKAEVASSPVASVPVANISTEAVASIPTPIKVTLASVTETPVMANVSGGVNFDELVSKWGEIISKLMVGNFSLGSVLRLSQPLGFNGNILEVGVTNSFYKGRLESNNSRPAIEAIISEVLGVSVGIRGIVKSDIQPLAVDITFTEEETPSEDQSSLAEVANSSQFNAPKLDVAEEVLNMF
jgi:DNA polymerase-3 subunit gamma/tau